MARPPSFNAVYVFSCCARLGSFKLAAEELCVTPGAVSRQIQSLEAHLGFPLFERRFRQVVLTHAGQLYFSQVSPALKTIEAAAGEARATAMRTPLNVEAMPTLAMHWLIPKLAGFQQLFPQIDLQLSTGSGPIRVRKGIDLYLRRDPAEFSGLAADPFMSESSQLVCSPGFLLKHGEIPPKEIYRYPLVMMRSRPDLWTTWFSENQMDINSVENRLLLDNTILAIQAVLEGLGVALIPSLFIEDYLKAGVLVRVPQTVASITGAYYLLPSPDSASAGMEPFCDWIREC